MATFMTLTDQDLKELGISTFGARRKMLLAIAGKSQEKKKVPVWPAGQVLDLYPRRVCAWVRSRPGHIQSCEYKEGLSDETMVPCTWHKSNLGPGALQGHFFEMPTKRELGGKIMICWSLCRREVQNVGLIHVEYNLGIPASSNM
jgi:hypothetical protein